MMIHTLQSLNILHILLLGHTLQVIHCVWIHVCCENHVQFVLYFSGTYKIEKKFSKKETNLLITCVTSVWCHGNDDDDVIVR